MKHLIKYKVFESDQEPKKAKDQPTIFFTDIVGSSKLWADDPKLMIKNLDKHFKTITTIVENFGGLVVKTIGDAFMVYFEPSNESLKLAIECCIEIIKTEPMDIRVGICCGDMIEREYTLQNAKLKDYFGNAVNTASRMESKVSESRCLTFSFIKDIDSKQSEDILEIIKDYSYDKIEFSDDCSNDKEMIGKRSARLLSDLDVSICKDINELDGINEIIAYKVKIK
jgi:hypothetical protein